MDELDDRIVELLRRDGRASNARIARDVGVSEGTVRRRLKRLIDDEVMHVAAVPNMEKLGYTTSALIGIQTDPGQVDSVADAIAELDQVHYVAITTGSFDIFVWAAVSSSEQLGKFIRSSLGTISGVNRTESFVNLNIRKRAYGLML